MSRTPEAVLTGELGLFRKEAVRFLPRDNRGRFVSLRRSGARAVIVDRARSMRAQLGLPPLPILEDKRA